MPNRIIKESICTSDTIDELSSFEEVVFYRLIVNCDDYGRFDARAKVLSAKLFPLKNISVEQMQGALDGLQRAGLLSVYHVDGRPYLQMKTWDKHQTKRAKKSKYPSKPESDCMQMQADEGECNHSPANVPVFENRESRNENRCSSRARAREENNTNDDFNPFGDDAPEHPEETLESYAANNVVNMHGRNMEYLADYMERMPSPLIRFAIDAANKHCKNGMPTWGYVETILKGYEARHFTTVAQAQMAEEERSKDKASARGVAQVEVALPGKFY